MSISGVVSGTAVAAYGINVSYSAYDNFGVNLDDIDWIKNNSYYKEGRPSNINAKEDKIIRRDKAKIKSDDFKDFLRANGENPNKWEKVMETWEKPDGSQIERHYWTNGKKSYYHD